MRSIEDVGTAAYLVGNLVEGRTCGSCNTCCQVFEIPELKKPRNTLCSHHTGSCCRVYPLRPDVCSQYYCLWRRIDVMPDLARPDRLGIIFTLVAEATPAATLNGLYVIGRAVNDPSAFTTPAGRRAIGMFVKQGSLPVFIAFGDQREMIYPEEPTHAAIPDPGNPDRAALRAAALEWWEGYRSTIAPGRNPTAPIRQSSAATPPRMSARLPTRAQARR